MSHGAAESMTDQKLIFADNNKSLFLILKICHLTGNTLVNVVSINDTYYADYC